MLHKTIYSLWARLPQRLPYWNFFVLSPATWISYMMELLQLELAIISQTLVIIEGVFPLVHKSRFDLDCIPITCLHVIPITCLHVIPISADPNSSTPVVVQVTFDQYSTMAYSCKRCPLHRKAVKEQQEKQATSWGWTTQHAWTRSYITFAVSMTLTIHQQQCNPVWINYDCMNQNSVSTS